MARPDTWMPMYWRDFWADTGHLSPVEGWAYLNLIGAYWTNGGPLANDDARLQRQAKVSSKEWRAARSTVIAFFSVDDDVIRHGRIDAELTEATRLYEKRRAHIDAVNEKRRKQQSLSTVTVHNDAPDTATTTATQPQLQPQSPNGENTEANASDTRKPKRATALPADWTPNERNLSDAKTRGYDTARIGELAEHFRDYHLAKGAPSKDWDASWRTWLANDKNFSAGRAGSGKPGPNRPSAGSVVDVVARLKARADLGGQGQRGGVGRSGDGVSDPVSNPGFAGESAVDRGEVIDADDAERMYRTARGVEASDGAEDRGVGQPGGPTWPLRAEARGVSGGRGSEGFDEPAEREQVVARVVGTQGAVGPLFSAPSEDDRGFEA